METCVMCDGSGDCEWCDNGVVPDSMLFKPPGDVKLRTVKPVRTTTLVAPPHDYQLITFLRKAPSYHLVKSTNEYHSAFTWCGEKGRILSIEPGEVPRCGPCEQAKAEDELTARQTVDSRRAQNQ